VAGRAHLSIGEVLSLLQEEFPDVTISKIRFLESQGLVDPERTPSGYRKFYEADIERLRWVLRQQRDAFLPLKVIKGRLEGQVPLDEADEAALGEGDILPPAEPPRGAEGPNGGHRHRQVRERPRTAEPAPVTGEGGSEGPEGGVRRGAGAVAAGRGPGAPVAGGEPEPVPEAEGPGQLFDAGPPSSAYGGPGRQPAPAEVVTGGGGPGGSRRAAGGRQSRPGRPNGGRGGPPGPAGDGEVGELSLEELLEKAGVDAAVVQDLERYGLVASRVVAGASYYPPDAAVVARLASAFARHGVEARHLRAFKGAAEREAGLVEQVIMPLVRQRNPEARRAAAETVEELSRLGGELRAAFLRSALADLR
jgi:DNA-binding transcriptional MerR regulator